MFLFKKKHTTLISIEGHLMTKSNTNIQAVTITIGNKHGMFNNMIWRRQYKIKKIQNNISIEGQIVMIKVTALILLLIACASSLNFKLSTGKQFCMRFKGANAYTLEYVVSGNQDKQVRCRVIHGQNVVLDKETVSEFQFSHEYVSQQPIEVCFVSTDNQEKEISFDFYQLNDPVRKMIDKKDVNLVQGALSEAFKQMEAISRNQEYQIQRDERHKDNLEDSQSKIKWAGIIKIVFLLGSALIQLWIMKGFFTTSNPYQPVEQV